MVQFWAWAAMTLFALYGDTKGTSLGILLAMVMSPANPFKPRSALVGTSDTTALMDDLYWNLDDGRLLFNGF